MYRADENLTQPLFGNMKIDHKLNTFILKWADDLFFLFKMLQEPNDWVKSYCLVYNEFEICAGFVTNSQGLPIDRLLGTSLNN